MNCDASEGYGGGIAIYSESGASGIIFNGKRLLFSGCDAIYGKHIFLGSNDFIETYSKTTFDYDYDVSDVNNLVGMIWDSNPQVVLLYKYVCQLTKKEYKWIESSHVCDEHADCSDICTAIEGWKNYIYFYFYNNMICLNIESTPTCGGSCYFVDKSYQFSSSTPDTSYCADDCLTGLYDKNINTKQCTLNVCNSRTTINVSQFPCGVEYVYYNFYFITFLIFVILYSCFFDEIKNKCSEECTNPLEKSLTDGICTCGIGKKPVNGECEECEEGKYSSSISSWKCTSCSPGEEPNDDKSKCSRCGEGKYSNSTTNFICSSCLAGEEPNEDQNRCLRCGEGEYSNETTKHICKSCIEGEEPNNDHTSCLTCEALTSEECNYNLFLTISCVWLEGNIDMNISGRCLSKVFFLFFDININKKS
jgi:hypothetical protein